MVVQDPSKLGVELNRLSLDKLDGADLPRAIQINIGNSEVQVWALKFGLLKESNESIAMDLAAFICERTVVDIESGMRSSKVRTLKLRNLLSPETLSSAIAALWPAHGFITNGAVGFSEVGGIIASLLACLLSAKKGLYKTIGNLEVAAIFLSIRDSHFKPMTTSELFGKTCDKLKSVDVLSFGRGDFDKSIQVLLNEKLVYESEHIWRIAESVVIKE